MDYTQSDWRPEAKPMHIQVEDKMRALVIGKPIVGARVTVPTGDLILDFQEDAILEIIKLNSFLESWQVSAPGLHLLVDAWGQVNQWGGHEV